MNTEQEYYYFRNTTNSTLIINDLTRPASIMPRSLSRSFTADEVRQSSDIRHFYQVGILVQEDSPLEVLPPPLKRTIRATIEPLPMPRSRVPEGVDVQALDDQGGTYVSAAGTEFVNPKFIVGDFVYIKGPSNLSGKIVGRRGTDGRWIVSLPDGRTAYAYEEGLLTVDQFAVSQPEQPQKKTLNASEVLKRGIVPPSRQREFERNTNTRIHADDVLRNRTAVPASQLHGRPFPKEVEAPVSGGRFNVDEVKSRPVSTGAEIVMGDGRVVNSETIMSERQHSGVSGIGQAPIQEPVDEDRGTIIINGGKENPLGGAEVTTGRLITDTIEHAGREMSKAEKKRIANKKYQEKVKAIKSVKAPTMPKNAPAYVAKFISATPGEQKLFIVKENDVEKLTELASFLPAGSPMKKMIDERVAQLQIA